MKNKLAIVVQVTMLLAGILLGLETEALSATYYVNASTGNDSNTGISEGSAFKTIQRAGDLMIAGDNCVVFPGNYPEKVTVRKSGGAGSPISFLASGNVIMKGFRIHGVDHIKIKGFEITGTEIDVWSREGRAVGSGIALEGRYCEITDNYIHDVAGIGIDMRGIWEMDAETTSSCIVRGNRIAYAGTCGIHVAGRNHLIENNDISHTLQYPPKLYDPPSYVDADGIRFFGTGHIIRKNYIHDILHAPDNVKDPHIDFFQTWETAYGIVFEQNLCVSPNTTGSNQIAMISQSAGKVGDLTFRNNIFIMNDPGYSPIRIEGNTGSTGYAEDFVIVNNVFAHPNGIGSAGIVLKDVKRALIKNNIFYDYGDSSYSYIYLENNVVDLDAGYNSVYKSDAKIPKGGPHPNDLWMVAPNFVDFAGGNFRLEENSPLIDAGIKLNEVPEDYDGVSRPKGSSNDIGAFEHSSVEPQPDKPKNLRIVKPEEEVAGF